MSSYEIDFARTITVYDKMNVFYKYKYYTSKNTMCGYC